MNAKRKTLGLGHRSAQAESKPQRLSWDGFRKALRLHVWPDRMQTLEALKHLWERMPAEEMEELPAMTLVLAVGTELDGACVPRPLVLNPRVEDAGDPAYALGLLVKESVLIFLDARLEGRPQEEVDWVVAHEFAHALRMREPEQQGLAAEQEVDQLVQTWGFTPPVLPPPMHIADVTEMFAKQLARRAIKDGVTKEDVLAAASRGIERAFEESKTIAVPPPPKDEP